MNKKVGGMNKKLSNLRLSLLSAAISAITASMAFAGPEGGQVTGGSGSISSTGNTTTIHQQTDRMAIDWQSYNIDVDERVQYIQPDSSSVSLNRILSNSASSIQGRIDANGQVILVNPHGIMFGENSIVNAGGILASGLSIDTDQFMNGDFTFKEIEGTDGAIIANGVINAASGGSVALLGKSVENNGLISAELGSVHFAAGREAVVTFGESGFIGVRVSDALVEEQMGVDAAVLNSGEINATGGQVLLTASTSRDTFSGVINTGDLEFDRSVVVNNDVGN